VTSPCRARIGGTGFEGPFLPGITKSTGIAKRLGGIYSFLFLFSCLQACAGAVWRSRFTSLRSPPKSLPLIMSTAGMIFLTSPLVKCNSGKLSRDRSRKRVQYYSSALPWRVAKNIPTRLLGIGNDFTVKPPASRCEVSSKILRSLTPSTRATGAAKPW